MDDQPPFPCVVPNCPALVRRATDRCAIHQHARLARDAGVSRLARCLSCRRVLKDNDWIEKETTFIKSKRGSTFGYRHVACEPPKARVSKREQRTALKPLWEVL